MAQFGTNQHKNGVAIRKSSHYPSAVANLPIEPLNDIVGPFAGPMLGGEITVEFLALCIVGQFINWIAVYPEDRGIQPYKQNVAIHYHFIDKIEKIL